MKITMTNTREGSPDGVTVNTYTAGQEYNVPARLGSLFVASGDATEEAKAPPAQPQTPPVVVAPVVTAPPDAPPAVAVVVGDKVEGLGTQGKTTTNPPANKKKGKGK